jgi:hypothetical protein
MINGLAGIKENKQDINDQINRQGGFKDCNWKSIGVTYDRKIPYPVITG